MSKSLDQMDDDELYRLGEQLENDTDATGLDWPALADKWLEEINRLDLLSMGCEIEKDSPLSCLLSSICASGHGLAIKQVARELRTSEVSIREWLEIGGNVPRGDGDVIPSP